MGPATGKAEACEDEGESPGLDRSNNSSPLSPLYSITSDVASPKFKSIFYFVLVGFFWVFGGLYGSETLLGNVSPAATFLGLVAAPIFYGLPTSLVLTELQLALPYDGSMVAWIEEILGSKIGGHNVFWVWVSYFLDAAVYPVLVAEYLQQSSALGELHNVNNAVPISASFMVATMLTVQLCGTTIFWSILPILGLLSLLPPLIFVFGGISDVSPSSWVDSNSVDGGSDFGLLLSWLLWLHQGYLSIGIITARASIDRSSTSICWVIIISTIPMLLLFNVMPLVVAWGQNQESENFKPGYLVVLSRELLGRWFEYMMLVGAIMSQSILHNSSSLASQRVLYYLMQTRCPETFGAEVDYSTQSAWFLRLWIHQSSGGVPVGFVILNTLMIGLSVWLPFKFLIQTSTLIASPSGLLLMLTYVRYKRSSREISRVFNASSNTLTAVLLILFPTLSMLGQIMFTLFDGETIQGIPNANAIFLACVMGIGGITHLGHDLWRFQYRFGDSDYRTEYEQQYLLAAANRRVRQYPPDDSDT